MGDEESKEYYKKYIHKNVGAKGTIEYFRVADLTEHDEQVRADEKAKVLKEVRKKYYDLEFGAFEAWLEKEYFHSNK